MKSEFYTISDAYNINHDYYDLCFMHLYSNIKIEQKSLNILTLCQSCQPASFILSLGTQDG